MLEDKLKILVFMKKGYEDIKLFLEQNFECKIFEGNWGDKFPRIRYNEKGIMFLKHMYDGDLPYTTTTDPIKFDWIISWLCPWKIPKGVLNRAKNGAINFHPGPPKYPGIGCYNYAIWNQDKEYGVTCHFMNENIDDGKIIDTYTFTTRNNETIESLKNRAIIYLKLLFYDTLNNILNKKQIPTIDKKWGEYKSRKDFQEFCKLDYKDFITYDEMGGIPQFNKKELEKRFRATYFKGARDGPYIEVNGKKWRLVPEEDFQ